MAPSRLMENVQVTKQRAEAQKPRKSRLQRFTGLSTRAVSQEKPNTGRQGSMNSRP